MIIVPCVDGIHSLGVLSTLLRPTELGHPSSLCHPKVNSNPAQPVCALCQEIGDQSPVHKALVLMAVT